MSAKKRNRPLPDVDRGFHRSWHELVQKPKRTDPTPRTGEFYKREFPQATITVDPPPDNYRGGREVRPHAVFSTDLHRRQGIAIFRRKELSHPVRRKQREERRAEKQRRAEAQAALIAMMRQEQAS